MGIYINLVFLISLNLTIISVAAKECILTLYIDDKANKKFAPVILTRPNANADFELFKPTGKDTAFPDGSESIFACTSRRKNQQQDTLKLKCTNGHFVDLNANQHQPSDFPCKSVPASVLEKTTATCSSGNGILYKVGFRIDSKFYSSVFEICYNEIAQKTLYTHNTINGAAIDDAAKNGERPKFKADCTDYTTSELDKIYKKENQFKIFENLFGSNQKYWKDQEYFFSRGHLAPFVDFIFAYEQTSTCYFANAAPEYQIINAGNWFEVENLSREVAKKYRANIESYTGYKDILQLPRAGQLVNVYLDDAKKIGVPKYFYKVLLHKASGSAIAFVTINNPYITNGPAEEICENVCEKSGLVHTSFRTLSKGYTFCCTLDAFLTWEKSLPAEVQGSKLLVLGTETTIGDKRDNGVVGNTKKRTRPRA